MTLTPEQQQAVQHVTERADDAPAVPAYRESDAARIDRLRKYARQALSHTAHMDACFNDGRAIFGLPPVERRRYRGKA